MVLAMEGILPIVGFLEHLAEGLWIFGGNYTYQMSTSLHVSFLLISTKP